VADQKDHSQDTGFKVVDRRLFTADGDLRKEGLEYERLEEKKEADKAAASKLAGNAKPAPAAAKTPEAVASRPEWAGGPQLVGVEPKTSVAEAEAAVEPAASRSFQILVDFLAGNAAARLGMIPDPQSGQAYLDLPGANELIDMIDALREKTQGNLAHEEEQLLFEVLRSLKLSYLEMSKAAAEALREKAKGKA
jgi:hypothetical protein